MINRCSRLPGLIESKRALTVDAKDFEGVAGVDIGTATRLETGATNGASSSSNGVLDQSESLAGEAKVAGRAATGGVAFR